MSEKELIAEIKKTLTKIANNNPSWKLVLGRETLSATEVIQRLGNDRKLRKFVVKHYVGLAVEMEQKARIQRFGEEK
ncbi:unnamed protein product [marine sediment metagenome]|uniref:Uncharacterized protein n=1 Tax=marine sediment metagenome TaxID=412755 RepID=X1QSB5_9ZZZZ